MNIDNIFNLIKENKINAKKLSDELNISTGNISDWKKGRSVPKADTLLKIANYFSVSVDYLLGRPSTHNELNDLCEAFIKADDVTKENIKKLLDM